MIPGVKPAEFAVPILPEHLVMSLSPVVAVALREHEGEEELEDDFAVVDAVAGHVRHEPVPKFGECPERGGMGSWRDHNDNRFDPTDER